MAAWMSSSLGATPGWSVIHTDRTIPSVPTPITPAFRGVPEPATSRSAGQVADVRLADRVLVVGQDRHHEVVLALPLLDQPGVVAGHAPDPDAGGPVEVSARSRTSSIWSLAGTGERGRKEMKDDRPLLQPLAEPVRAVASRSRSPARRTARSREPDRQPSRSCAALLLVEALPGPRVAVVRTNAGHSIHWCGQRGSPQRGEVALARLSIMSIIGVHEAGAKARSSPVSGPPQGDRCPGRRSRIAHRATS